jgi:hypothetical protein
MLPDFVRALWLLPSVERARLSWGPAPAIEFFRKMGRTQRARTAPQRAMLRRAVALADRLWPGEPNCYRRVLLEVAMDAGAAEERVNLGLKAHGGPRSGHAWLGSAPDVADTYDVALSL